MDGCHQRTLPRLRRDEVAGPARRHCSCLTRRQVEARDRSYRGKEVLPVRGRGSASLPHADHDDEVSTQPGAAAVAHPKVNPVVLAWPRAFAVQKLDAESWAWGGVVETVDESMKCIDK